MEIWLNPACSKCRTAISTLDEAGRYLDEVPTPEELADVLARLGLEPWDIARDKEAKEEGIELPRTPDHREAWLLALAQHPQVIQRPIITAADGTTVVGRDPEALAAVVAAES
jgi:arsenate reductase